MRGRNTPKVLASRVCLGTPWKWCKAAIAPQQSSMVEWALVAVQSRICVISFQ